MLLFSLVIFQGIIRSFWDLNDVNDLIDLAASDPRDAILPMLPPGESGA